MVSWSWSGAAQGADSGAKAGCSAGPWGCLGGFVGGGIMGGLMPDGNSLHDYREALDDQLQRQRDQFKWYQDQGLHPLSAMSGGTASFSGPAASRSGRGDYTLDGVAATAEALSRRKLELARLDIDRRVANAQIDEMEASAMRHRAEAMAANNATLREATSRSVSGRLNANKDAEGFLGIAPLARAEGMDAEDFEMRYGDVAAEFVGIGNLIRDGWLSVGGPKFYESVKRSVTKKAAKEQKKRDASYLEVPY